VLTRSPLFVKDPYLSGFSYFGPVYRSNNSGTAFLVNIASILCIQALTAEHIPHITKSLT
jgi:hypothetical protein